MGSREETRSLIAEMQSLQPDQPDARERLCIVAERLDNTSFHDDGDARDALETMREKASALGMMSDTHVVATIRELAAIRPVGW